MHQPAISAVLELTPGAVRLAQVRALLGGSCQVRLTPGWQQRVDAAAEVIRGKLEAGEVMYGINTGFGLLARTRIPPGKLEELQLAIVRSHAAGTGQLLAPGVVRLVLALKAASLARGYSGVRRVVI